MSEKEFAGWLACQPLTQEARRWAAMVYATSGEAAARQFVANALAGRAKVPAGWPLKSRKDKLKL